MNSQQELLDAINTIAQTKDKSCDTPATVLRVEGDTVWVHIDGGADETPVRKTINCEQGEIVQVRISNGSAFLVGNASAPPTDDKTAKVAHFMAEEAGVRAVEAQDTAAEAQERATIAQTAAAAAQAAVAQSLITYETWYILSATTPTQPTEDSHTGWSTAEPAWSSSSTDKLYFSVRTVKGDGTATWSAVGMVQSYADLQILKNAIISTVANNYVGQGDSGITELSSTMLQNSNGVNIYNDTLAVGDSYAHIDGDSFDIKKATTAGTIDDTNDEVLASFGQEVVLGNKGGCHMEISDQVISVYDEVYNVVNMSSDGIVAGLPSTTWAYMHERGLGVCNRTGLRTGDFAYYNSDEIYLEKIWEDAGNTVWRNLTIASDGITGNDFGLYDSQGTSLLPAILTSPTISASATSYTFTDSRIKSDSVIDIYDTIFNFNAINAVAVNGSCTITFPAQGSTHQIKLFIYGWNKED